MQIYLDHGATTPPRDEVISFLMAAYQSHWGNPSSLHTWGERATMVIERARMQVADLLNGDPEGIIFTSGGTEADNLAIMGVVRQYATPQHIITTTVEHSAVREPIAQLERNGWQVTRLPVDQHGLVQVTDLQAALRPNTVLVSIILANNEVGTIQPIAELVRVCREAKGTTDLLFHTDAVQAVGHIPVDVTALGIDLLSLAGHKFYGPQGVGALYVRPEVLHRLQPQALGGGQEQGLRSGTQPVALIGGLGVAAELAAQELNLETLRLRALRDRLWFQLQCLPDVQLTGAAINLNPHGYHSSPQRLPHHLSFCCSQRVGRHLVRDLNLAGIAASSGSACSSGSITPSAVLLAMGYDEKAALGSLRLTLGRHTEIEDIDWTAMVLRQILGNGQPCGKFEGAKEGAKSVALPMPDCCLAMV
jgi:cysteine desulfurase